MDNRSGDCATISRAPAPLTALPRLPDTVEHNACAVLPHEHVRCDELVWGKGPYLPEAQRFNANDVQGVYTHAGNLTPPAG